MAGSASCVTGTSAMAAVPDVGTLTNVLTSKWVWQLAQYFTFQRLSTASVPRETCFPLTLPKTETRKGASDSCSVDPGDANDFGRGSRRRRDCGHGLVGQRTRAVGVAQLAFDIEAAARGKRLVIVLAERVKRAVQIEPGIGCYAQCGALAVHRIGTERQFRESRSHRAKFGSRYWQNRPLRSFDYSSCRALASTMAPEIAEADCLVISRRPEGDAA